MTQSGPPNWFVFVLYGVVAAVMYGIGTLLRDDKVKPNLLMGVRTPKTLKDRDAWYRANRVAGRSMVVMGGILLAISLAGILFNLPVQQTILGATGIIMVWALYMVVASIRASHDESLPGAPGSVSNPTPKPLSDEGRKPPVRS